MGVGTSPPVFYASVLEAPISGDEELRIRKPEPFCPAEDKRATRRAEGSSKGAAKESPSDCVRSREPSTVGGCPQAEARPETRGGGPQAPGRYRGSRSASHRCLGAGNLLPARGFAGARRSQLYDSPLLRGRPRKLGVPARRTELTPEGRAVDFSSTEKEIHEDSKQKD